MQNTNPIWKGFLIGITDKKTLEAKKVYHKKIITAPLTLRLCVVNRKIVHFCKGQITLQQCKHTVCVFRDGGGVKARNPE